MADQKPRATTGTAEPLGDPASTPPGSSEATADSSVGGQHHDVPSHTKSSALPTTGPDDGDGANQQSGQEDITFVTVSTVIQAASFQMMPFRLACAIAMAIVAVNNDWDSGGIPFVVRMVLANIVLILSSAWMLSKEPNTCRKILKQTIIRGINCWDPYLSFAATITKIPMWLMKVAAALAWTAYFDSGVYLAAVVLVYTLRASPSQVPSRLAQVPDAAQEVLDNIEGVFHP
jgi:hypothetical protein